MADTIKEIPLEELHPFPDHPFGVRDDDTMQQTVESVREYGVLVPGIARPREDGGFEIIAGHRRKHACELAGLKTMPIIVRDIDQNTATIIMVDSNLQRENILPSEKAKAYKMKLEAIKRRAGRPSRNSVQVGQNFDGKSSREQIAENSPDMSVMFQGFESTDGETTEDGKSPFAFTPDGNLTLIDDFLQIEAPATEDSEQIEKQFITVQSKNGNTFYIVIDRNGETENVYFLNLVDEADLMALMESEDGETASPTCSCTDKCVVGAINTNCEICRTNMSECTGKEPVVEPEPTEPVEEPTEEPKSTNFLPIIIVLILGAGGFAVYWFKFRKPKTKTSGSSDLDDYDFGEDDEDYDEETELDDADVMAEAESEDEDA